VNFSVLSDYRHFLFAQELAKVGEAHAHKLFTIVLSFLKDRDIHSTVLRSVFDKCAELLSNGEAPTTFCEIGVSQMLPLDDSATCDSVCHIISRLFKYSAQFFSLNFEYNLRALIHSNPSQAIKLLAIYAGQFDQIENPWPLLDLLITQSKTWIRSLVGHDVIYLIVSLLKSHGTFWMNRLRQCRETLSLFLSSHDKNAVIAAYKALADLYDHSLDVNFPLLESHLADWELMVPAVTFLTQLEEIPSVTEIALPIIRVVRENQSATEVLLRLLRWCW
jgi:hypothetical protein